MKTFKIISISVIISVILIVIISHFRPFLYFTEAPSENWWTALSIIVAICFGVIAISLTVLLREKESKEKVALLEKNLEEYHTDYKEKYGNVLNFISTILDVQNIAETGSDLIWKKIKNKLGTINDIEPNTLRVWSMIAWKQGQITVAREFREKAYKLDTKDFRSRVMLCSILTQDKIPDNTRIENIFNSTDLTSENITDEDIDHFYSIQGTFYKKIGKFEKASEAFKKALKVNIQTWSFNEYILTLIMREDIDSKFIESEINRIKKIPNSKWLDDKVGYQKTFRLFANGFINESGIDKFFKHLTSWKISELVYRYNNEYVKMEFFNFYSQITKKYNNKELNILYLTFYKLLGVYDDKAENELKKQETLDEINKKMIGYNDVLR